MTDTQPTSTINWNLLIWCIVVIVELLILTVLLGTWLILLVGLVLIAPIRAALDWREAPPPPPPSFLDDPEINHGKN